jgi:hypothetical protein
MNWVILFVFLAMAGTGVGLIHLRNQALREASVEDGELESDFISSDTSSVRIDV